MPGIPGLNGGYYGALPAVQPAHSSAPVNLLGPGGPINSLVGAPGNHSVNESSFNSTYVSNFKKTKNKKQAWVMTSATVIGIVSGRKFPVWLMMRPLTG